MWVLTGVMLEKMGTQSAQQAWEPCIVCINVDMNWTRMIQTAAVICVIEWWVYVESECGWFCYFVVFLLIYGFDFYDHCELLETCFHRW